VISLSEIVHDRIIELRTIYDHFYDVPTEVQKVLDSSPKIENESVHTIKKAVPIIYQGHLEILKSVIVPYRDNETKEKVEERLQRFETTVDKLMELCDDSAYPVRICKRRTNCCGIFLKSLFHESKQMGIVLRKSFKGNHVWIPTSIKEGVKIDAMFFTANEEPLILDKTLHTSENSSYLDHDTFILCNPNAMSYQHMVNYP